MRVSVVGAPRIDSDFPEATSMHVSMLVRRRLALLTALAALGACSDASMAPRPAERPAFDIDALQPLDSRSSGGSNGAAASSSTDESVATFTIDPNWPRTYAFGDNWIYFPARAICDPATSGYGPSFWEAPCTPVTKPMQVTVHWSTKGGHAYARFSPELRFVPADARSVSRWVVLSLRDNRRISAADVYSILYNGTGTNGWVDESLTDPTLRAWIDPLRNAVVRRVKHFSGYMVAAANAGGMGGMDATY
jgi:hypothetical protein